MEAPGIRDPSPLARKRGALLAHCQAAKQGFIGCFEAGLVIARHSSSS
jgi:hypothetical protein